MWLVAAALFSACKILSWVNLERPGVLPPGRLLGYLLLWPGMRPQPFLPASSPVAVPQEDLWISAFRNLFVGLLLFGAALLAELPWWLRCWLGMAGFSFVVHFGMFDLLAVAWRRGGVPVEKLFVFPLAARSLADFWGNRWNRAFSAFARDLIFRPLVRRLGTAAATLAVFLFSGIAHELVISVPAAGGYGGPTFYFLIQGTLVVVENTRAFRRALRSRPVLARVWTVAGVLGPVALLFHRPFLENVMLPFLAAPGG
jgi:alginate O-acetyltransferase complex protein AlgI